MSMAMGVPLLPAAETLMPYLRRIDGNRYYTNNGPLLREYEERLSRLFGCFVAAVGSATAGLTASLLTLGPSKVPLTVPAWSFIATANAAVNARRRFDFVDVDETSWTAIADIVVCPFGAPADTREAKLVDAAAAFDIYASGQVTVGNAPVVISTHATKVFATGEGGLVLSRDKKFIGEIKTIVNHGITLDRTARVVGVNGKLSEYHAAVGLAELDHWAWKRQLWLEAKTRYLKVFGSLARTTPLLSTAWVGSTFCLRLPASFDSGVVRAKLEEQGITSRKVWGNGIHKYAAYDTGQRFPVTEKLANEVVFLPFSIDSGDAQLRTIAEALEKATD